MTGAALTLRPVQADEGPALAELRVLAMRDSLQALGRFDPDRARARFLGSFEPAHTRAIVSAGQTAGFVVLRPEGGHWLLDHLYIVPGHQGQGLGAQVLERVFAEADQAGQVLRVGALKGSRSNAFYLRHGFVPVDAGEWDLYYQRQPRTPAQPLAEHRCPLCGQPNGCAAASSGRFDTPCWCSNATFTPTLLALVPAAQRGRACICKSCAEGGAA